MPKRRFAGPRDSDPAARSADEDEGAEEDKEEDALAFRAAVRDVKPLKATAAASSAATVRRPPRRRTQAAAESLDVAMPLIDTAPGPDTPLELNVEGGVAGADALAFSRGGVRTQVLRKLRRGLYPIEDELDLHGMNQTSARELLADFLLRSRASGRRCVRIIHGKGSRSGARGPVLKMAVNLWLRRHFDVMAFVSARAIDGGTGALYVLLRA